MSEDSSEIELSALRTIAKGAGIVFSGLIISKILSYLFRVFIARFYGPSDYGIFTLGLAIVSILVIIAVLGLSSGVTRYIAEYIAKKNFEGVKGVITSSMKMVFPLSIIFSIILFMSSSFLAIDVFHMPKLSEVLMILALSLPFSAGFSVILASFLGFRKIKYKVYTESIFQNFLNLILVVLFGFFGYGLFGFSIAWLISTIITFFLGLYFLEKRTFRIIHTKISSISLEKNLLTYSMPLLLTYFLGVMVVYTDTLMLGYFKDASEVGIYNAAMPTAKILLMVSAALTSLFLPIITELYVKNMKREFENIFKTITRWIFFFNFPLFMLFILFSQQALRILFGEPYVTGYISLSFLSFGFFISNTGKPLERIFEMNKKTKVLLYITLFVFIINFSLNYLLIPSSIELFGLPIYGYTGAAFASMLTYIFSFVFLMIISYKYTKFNPFSIDILKAAICVILSVLIIYYIKEIFFEASSVIILLILFIFYLILYLLFLLLFKCFRREDIEIIKVIEKKTGIRISFFRKTIKRFIY